MQGDELSNTSNSAAVNPENTSTSRADVVGWSSVAQGWTVQLCPFNAASGSTSKAFSQARKFL